MSIFIRPRRSTQADTDNPYWMSFADIMAGLLVIFILVCMALLLRLAQVQEQVLANSEKLKDSTRARSAILYEIKDELLKQGIFVEVVDNDSVLRIPEEAFHFETGRFDVPIERQKTAQSIGQALYNAIARSERWQHLETVFIEGHSDKRQALNYRMGNWELSALRAISLWQFWVTQKEYGPSLASLLNTNGKKLFSVSGYAETRPTEKGEMMDDSEEAMRKDRRIDVRFTTKQLSEKDLNSITAPLRGE